MYKNYQFEYTSSDPEINVINNQNSSLTNEEKEYYEKKIEFLKEKLNKYRSEKGNDSDGSYNGNENNYTYIYIYLIFFLNI